MNWIIFRLLLSQGWKDLEGHVTRRRGSRSWNFVEKHIVPKLISITDENQNCIFTQDEIHLAAGVLDTNSFELNHDNKVGQYLRRPKAPCNSRLYLKFGRCLFLKSAMFNNNCVPNCVRRVVSGTIEIIAVRLLCGVVCLFLDNYEDISTPGRFPQARSCLSATRTSCCRHLSDKKYF